MNLRKDIRKFLDKNKWSEAKLARVSGVDQRTVNKFLKDETKDITLTTYNKIADIVYGGRKLIK